MNCIIESWNRFEPELRGYLTRQLQDGRLAEDLLQDVFVKAIAEGAGFCSLENPRAWLFRVTRNQLIDSLRRNKNMIELSDDLAEVVEEIPAVETLSACLPRALETLNEQDRDVITRCDLNGMNQSDYANIRGISLSGAKSRIQRARQRLKAQLNEVCQVSFNDSGDVCCFVPCSEDDK